MGIFWGGFFKNKIFPVSLCVFAPRGRAIINKLQHPPSGPRFIHPQSKPAHPTRAAAHREYLACPVSDAIQLRQFSFDFFKFGKKGFALRFKCCVLFSAPRVVPYREETQAPATSRAFRAARSPLQTVQFVAMFGLELFSLAIPVNAFVFLLNRLQFSDGLNRAKQRVDISDSAFLCRRFRFDFGKCPVSFRRCTVRADRPCKARDSRGRKPP